MWSIFKRDLLLAYRSKGQALNPLLFFIIVSSLFPLAISNNLHLLSDIGPGVIWVAALLAMLLSMQTLFSEDKQDGSLQLLLLSPQSSLLLVYGQLFAHWVIFALPLILATSIIGVMFHLSAAAIWLLMRSVALSTVTLIFIGSIGASLTVNIKRSGVLLTLILLPLYVPILIFSASLVPQLNMGLPLTGAWDLLFAFFCIAVILAPMVSLAVLRLF